MPDLIPHEAAATLSARQHAALNFEPRSECSAWGSLIFRRGSGELNNEQAVSLKPEAVVEAAHRHVAGEPARSAQANAMIMASATMTTARAEGDGTLRAQTAPDFILAISARDCRSNSPN